MIDCKWCIATGVGRDQRPLVAFDKALLNAGVGNYNLVKLSSILPAKAVWCDTRILRKDVPDGSLLPTAYATISSDKLRDRLVS